MNKKAFIIILETNIFDNDKLNKMFVALKQDKDVNSWWHHINNTFMITTNSNVTALSIQKFIKNYFTDSHFMILQIHSPDEYNGWLPQNAWDWIESNLK
jgi:predicted regulator of amino acid metabolism with ACT domain